MIREEKQRLRREMLRLRKEMPAAQRTAADAVIAERVLSDRAFQCAETVLLYAAMPHEVGTARLIGACLSAGKTLGLPVCDTAAHTMQFYRLSDTAELSAGAYGIPVPPVSEARLLEPEQNTLMLVPMLCFDSEGYRLGAGGGFYDRYFAAHPGLQRLGLCYAACRIPLLPHDRYDIPLQRCITEQTTEEFSHGK